MNANTFKVIYQSIARNFCTIDIQIAYFCILYISQKWKSTLRNGYRLVISIQNSTERIQVVSTLNITRAIFCNTDWFPSILKRNVIFLTQI